MNMEKSRFFGGLLLGSAQASLHLSLDERAKEGLEIPFLLIEDIVIFFFLLFNSSSVSTFPAIVAAKMEI